MQGASPLCMTCKHLNRDEDREIFNCEAFPNGVPDKIIDGEIEHTKPVKGDHGIQYEPFNPLEVTSNK